MGEILGVGVSGDIRRGEAELRVGRGEEGDTNQ